MAHHRTTCEPGRTSPYHVDIRLRMLWQRYAQQKTLRQIACNLCVSAGTVSNIVMLYETTGSLSPWKPVKSSSFSHRYAFSKKEISHAPSSAAAVLCENAEVFEL